MTSIPLSLPPSSVATVESASGQDSAVRAQPVALPARMAIDPNLADLASSGATVALALKLSSASNAAQILLEAASVQTGAQVRSVAVSGAGQVRLDFAAESLPSLTFAATAEQGQALASAIESQLSLQLIVDISEPLSGAPPALLLTAGPSQQNPQALASGSAGQAGGTQPLTAASGGSQPAATTAPAQGTGAQALPQAVQSTPGTLAAARALAAGGGVAQVVDEQGAAAESVVPTGPVTVSGPVTLDVRAPQILAWPVASSDAARLISVDDLEEPAVLETVLARISETLQSIPQAAEDSATQAGEDVTLPIPSQVATNQGVPTGGPTASGPLVPGQTTQAQTVQLQAGQLQTSQAETAGGLAGAQSPMTEPEILTDRGGAQLVSQPQLFAVSLVETETPQTTSPAAEQAFEEAFAATGSSDNSASALAPSLQPGTQPVGQSVGQSGVASPMTASSGSAPASSPALMAQVAEQLPNGLSVLKIADTLWLTKTIPNLMQAGGTLALTPLDEEVSALRGSILVQAGIRFATSAATDTDAARQAVLAQEAKTESMLTSMALAQRSSLLDPSVPLATRLAGEMFLLATALERGVSLPMLMGSAETMSELPQLLRDAFASLAAKWQAGAIMEQMAQLVDQSGHNWQSARLPESLASWFVPLQFFIQRQPRAAARGGKDERRRKSRKVRFLVDVRFRRFGQTQLDGLAGQKSLDLALRSERGLGEDLRAALTVRFAELGELCGFQGRLSFQDGAGALVRWRHKSGVPDPLCRL